mgnify:CR=1 FL=1
MILTDAGPLIALLDKRDGCHQICVDALALLPAEPMLTTWPCFTEAMHILGAVNGYRYQSRLWRFIEGGKLRIHDLTAAEIKKMNALMKKYQDTPMDLADASLIVAADSLSFKQIFTIDSDFRFYRLSDDSVLELLP